MHRWTHLPSEILPLLRCQRGHAALRAADKAPIDRGRTCLDGGSAARGMEARSMAVAPSPPGAWRIVLQTCAPDVPTMGERSSGPHDDKVGHHSCFTSHAILTHLQPTAEAAGARSSAHASGALQLVHRRDGPGHRRHRPSLNAHQTSWILCTLKPRKRSAGDPLALIICTREREVASTHPQREPPAHAAVRGRPTPPPKRLTRKPSAPTCHQGSRPHRAASKAVPHPACQEWGHHTQQPNGPELPPSRCS